ncbi:MAG: DUF2813 domain-containing protein [Deltaproteobacteria bacterium]|nr:DUF2813 domain-containing protein [Deltaproteobacteria bacterium]
MVPKIRRVKICNFKSFAHLSVDLETLTIFVGPNASGKSNFLKALAFVKDCLATSVEQAFRIHGGIEYVRRISPGHPYNVRIELMLDLDNDVVASYGFEIAAQPKKTFQIAKEQCRIKYPFTEEKEFKIEGGIFKKEIPGIMPKLAPDRLALFAASAHEDFRPVYDFLTSMRFYAIIPQKLRELQEPGAGNFLESDGSNAASVLKNIQRIISERGKYERICNLLSRIVPGVKQVETGSLAHMETIIFKLDVGSKHYWNFDAFNMSDGALRILGLLLALYQPGNPRVIAIEEPEATVHPAAMEVIVEVVLDAIHEKQILLTTHSPDILDFKSLSDENIRVVMREKNCTIISRISPSGRDAIKKHLYSPGELMRIGELNPDMEGPQEMIKQRTLFKPPSFSKKSK